MFENLYNYFIPANYCPILTLLSAIEKFVVLLFVVHQDVVIL